MSAQSCSFRELGKSTEGELALVETSSLSYYRARYYDTGPARFLIEDPVRFAGGTNFYSYVHNRPLNLRDPRGRVAWVGGIGGSPSLGD
jgi:RHS repeat-associated protein